MLARQPHRFLLADDPGVGKNTVPGLLMKEMSRVASCSDVWPFASEPGRHLVPTGERVPTGESLGRRADAGCMHSSRSVYARGGVAGRTYAPMARSSAAGSVLETKPVAPSRVSLSRVA